MKNQSFARRMGFALSGLASAWRRERSLRTQGLIALAVMAALAVLRPAGMWWALAFLAIGLVLAAELVNAAIEALADRLHPELHPEIKAVKDMAAAAVLVAALTAVAVAVAFVAG